MKCMQFDKQDAAALRALKFTIAEDGEIAKLKGQIQLEFIRPDGSEQLWLSITLPSGEELTATVPRDRLIEAAGIDQEDC